MTKITLAGQSFDVPPPPFGKLRKIISAFNVMRNDSGSEEAMDKAALIFSLLTNKTVAEIDEMPIGVLEMAAALAQVPEICGLVEVVPSGEA